jgi:hypothetical protein
MALIKDWIDPRTGETIKYCYVVITRYEVIGKRMFGKMSAYVSKEAHDAGYGPISEMAIDNPGKDMIVDYSAPQTVCGQLYLIAKAQLKTAIDDDVYFAAKEAKKVIVSENPVEEPVEKYP